MLFKHIAMTRQSHSLAAICIRGHSDPAGNVIGTTMLWSLQVVHLRSQLPRTGHEHCRKGTSVEIFLAYAGIPVWTGIYCSPESKCSLPATTLGILSPYLSTTLDESFIPVWQKIILRSAGNIIFPSFPGKPFRSLAFILHCSCPSRYAGILKKLPLRFTIKTTILTTPW